MYALGGVLGELAKVVVGLAVATFLAIPRRRKSSGQGGRGLRDQLVIEVAKVVTTLTVGAALASWYERKKGQQERQALAELREGIRDDVLQAISQWSAQGRLTIETDERSGEIVGVSSRGET